MTPAYVMIDLSVFTKIPQITGPGYADLGIVCDVIEGQPIIHQIGTEAS
jgi:hypothetical protein